MLKGGEGYLFQSLFHNIWSVIDGEDDVRDAGSGEAFDLMENHGPIGELDQRLGESEGLIRVKGLLERGRL